MKYLPGPSEWLFSFKTFAAGMLALYIGLATGLDRPYWALATVYIVSQPLTGSLRSKGVYRLTGTILGAIVCIALVPNLVDTPALLSFVLAAWTGTCLYVSLLDRSPRSYVFMLAGYTAAIIGFPSVDAPGAIWDTALWRVEEISLGIVCSTLVGSLVFPRAVGPVLVQRLRGWWDGAGHWIEDAMAGRPDSAAFSAGRAKLMAELVEIGQLETYLAFDTSVQRGTTRYARALRERMAALPIVLSSIADRVSALRSEGALDASLATLMDELVAWRWAGCEPAKGAELREAIAARMTVADSRGDWDGALTVSLLQRLRELTLIEEDDERLLDHIADGRQTFDGHLLFRQAAVIRQHRDHGMAALSGASAGLAVLIVCAFWIASGWPTGSVAAEMAAVACSFFASRDNPVPAIFGFLYASVAAVAIDAVLLFAVLPAAHDFETLVAALALFLLPTGAFMSLPATAATGMAIAANGATLLGLQSTYAADFATFMEGGVALVLGMTAAAVITSLFRSVGGRWSAERLLRRVWRDLATVADGRHQREAATLTGLSVDRLGLVAARLVGTADQDLASEAFADLRVARNLMILRRVRTGAHDPFAARLDAVLDGASRHYAGRAAGRATPVSLLAEIDAALDQLGGGLVRRRRDALLALVGVRRGLFPAAAAYRPAETLEPVVA